jgi:tellurite methyltransferase
MTVQEQFGNIDIYVFDQLLRGRIAPGMRVFDAGCGGGRNLVYFLRNGYEVCGNDADANAIASVRSLAASLAPGRHYDFRVEAIEETSFPDAHADVVMASAVLHFARDPHHFEAMLREMWRVLRPGGLFFARLASSIGIENLIRPIGGPASAAVAGRFRSLPGGRRCDRGLDPRPGRHADRSDQDHGGPLPACDDHVGRAPPIE